MDQDIKESLELRKEFPKSFSEVHLKWNEVCAIVRELILLQNVLQELYVHLQN